MRRDVLHIQFEFLFYLRQTDVSVWMRLKAWLTQQADKVSHLVSSGCSQWEQEEMKHCLAVNCCGLW